MIADDDVIDLSFEVSLILKDLGYNLDKMDIYPLEDGGICFEDGKIKLELLNNGVILFNNIEYKKLKDIVWKQD